MLLTFLLHISTEEDNWHDLAVIFYLQHAQYSVISLQLQYSHQL